MGAAKLLQSKHAASWLDVLQQMYDRYIVEHSYNIYGSTLVKLPTPRYTVLYNGTSKQPAFMKLKLSDAFIHEVTSGDFEWTANMVNINHGMMMSF